MSNSPAVMQALAKAGVKYVAEGANMPSEADAIKVYHDNKMLFGPAKVRTRHLPGITGSVSNARELLARIHARIHSASPWPGTCGMRMAGKHAGSPRNCIVLW